MFYNRVKLDYKIKFNFREKQGSDSMRLSSLRKRIKKMTPTVYFNFIKTKMVKDFLKTFGGNFSYSPEFAYTYENGEKIFFLGGHDLKKDISKSIENKENLLLTYEEVHW